MTNNNRMIGVVPAEMIERVFGMESGALESCRWDWSRRQLQIMFRTPQGEPIAPGAVPKMVNLSPGTTFTKTDNKRPECCETCRFWKRKYPIESGCLNGLCRRRPALETLAAFPSVDGSEWCGSYICDPEKQTYQEYQYQLSKVSDNGSPVV